MTPYAAPIDSRFIRFLDVLQEREPLTAGELAVEAGLTTGAVTTVLDRLERAGYALRVRDTHDRRRILVELTPGRASCSPICTAPWPRPAGRG